MSSDNQGSTLIMKKTWGVDISNEFHNHIVNVKYIENIVQ